MTGGVLGNGSKIAYSIGSPMSWVKLGQLREIPNFFQLVANDVDVDTHGPSAIMREMPGKIPCPELACTLIADLDASTSASHEVMRQYQSGSGLPTAGVTIYFRIEAPTDRGQTAFRAREFSGFVKGWTVTLSRTDAQMLELIVKFDGDGIHTFPAGASQIS